VAVEAVIENPVVRPPKVRSKPWQNGGTVDAAVKYFPVENGAADMYFVSETLVFRMV
jgi:hypothetical protein